MISVTGLSRRYGDFTAVDNVSFEIGSGEIVGLLGHNGAGKTTIMKMLTGFLEPSAGDIRIAGLDIAVERRAVQAKIGYLPENCPVYPEMTVIDYLEYAAALHGVPESARAAAIRQAIERTDLAPKADQLINTLSRGYRQRVGVAQAILHEPSILILDEPTNGLDPTQIQHMRDLVLELAKHATVILSTHILQEVQAICDRVLIVRQGALALDAKLDALRDASRLLVGLDVAPEQANEVLSGIEGVGAVSHEQSDDGLYEYALQLSAGIQAMRAVAPGVASDVQARGWKLYSLYPEQRDLETVFGEINAGQTVKTGEASHV